MTPWEKLNAAADLLARSVYAVPGPWRAYRDFGLTSIDSPAEDLPVCTDASTSGEWIAVMSPDKAPTLAAWLLLAAKDYETRESFPKLGEPNPRGVPFNTVGAFGPCWQTLALDFAELIIGGAA